MQIKSWHLALLGLFFYIVSVIFSLGKTDLDLNLGEYAAGLFRVAGEDCIYLLPLLLSMLSLQTGQAKKLGAVLAIFTGFLVTVALLYTIFSYQKSLPMDSAAFILSSLSLTSAGLIFFWSENKKAVGGISEKMAQQSDAIPK
jgi:hypothetical protein